MPTLEIEDSLCHALEAAGQDYDLAVRQIAEISEEIASGRGHEEIYARLQQVAGRTRQTEAGLARLRDEWQRYGQKPGNRLRTILQRQEGLLRKLIESLNDAEQVARSARGTLVQVVDESARSHQMHSAYARTIRQAAE